MRSSHLCVPKFNDQTRQISETVWLDKLRGDNIRAHIFLPVAGRRGIGAKFHIRQDSSASSRFDLDSRQFFCETCIRIFMTFESDPFRNFFQHRLAKALTNLSRTVPCREMKSDNTKMYFISERAKKEAAHLEMRNRAAWKYRFYRSYCENSRANSIRSANRRDIKKALRQTGIASTVFDERVKSDKYCFDL